MTQPPHTLTSTTPVFKDPPSSHAYLHRRHKVIKHMAVSYQARKAREGAKQQRWHLPEWAGRLADNLFWLLLCGIPPPPKAEGREAPPAPAPREEKGEGEAELDTAGDDEGAAARVEDGILYDGAIDEQVCRALLCRISMLRKPTYGFSLKTRGASACGPEVCRVAATSMAAGCGGTDLGRYTECSGRVHAEVPGGGRDHPV